MAKGNNFIPLAIVCCLLNPSNAFNHLRSNSAKALNDQPIIGILAQQPMSVAPASPDSSSYIAASYVKWIEAAGGRVVPVRLNQSETYYTNLFNSINGLLFPGGGSSLETSDYAKVGSIMYDLAIQANDNGDFFPVWGTCLGFQFLLHLAAGKKSYLTFCQSNDVALNITLLNGATTSRLYADAPEDVMRTLTTEDSTAHFHNWGITMQNFTSAGLENFYNPLSTSFDRVNLEFISSIEAINYPFWGVQFHPEKNLYEWGKAFKSIPHSHSAEHSSQYFAEFFVNQARKNYHQFASEEEEIANLIYNYQPLYTGHVSDDFIQSYFFD